MTLLENPIALEKTAEQLEANIFAFQERLLQNKIETSGPFIGKPALTKRDTFREFRESSLPEELKQAWLVWAFRFSEARVNGPYCATLAEAYRVERHLIDPSDTVTMTLRELFFNVLVTSGQRDRYLSILSQRTARYRELFLESWARRVELAHRAGFPSLDAVEAPTTELETLAEVVLKRTSDPFAELVTPEVETYFDAALARDASAGFPAKLSARSLRALLGDDAWLAGLNPRIKRWVYPLSPASFCRGLMRLGAAMLDAAAPRNQPFVIARDPNGLQRRTLGALLGHLPSYAPFHRHRLHLSQAHATAQARSLTLSSLLHLRVSALSVLLRARLCRNRATAESDYEALCAETFGFPLPVQLLGLFPRLHPDAGQRLLGPVLANRLHHFLVSEFDEDWFRNPRGIEHVRASLDRVPERIVKFEDAKTALEATLDDYLARLS